MTAAARTRRIGLPLVALAALAIVLGGAWVWTRAAANGSGEAGWVEVRRGDLTLEVEVNGRLRAVDTSQLGPPQIPDVWQFKIAFMAPEGQVVAAGSPVLGFDPSELQKRLIQERAEAEQAAKEIEKTQRDLELSRRQDDLRLAEARARLRRAELKASQPGELVMEHELRVARLDLELARNEVAYLERRLEASTRSAAATLAALENQKSRAEEQVREIQSAIAQMTVAAPRDGTVVYVTDWNDEKKKVGDGCWRNQSVIEVPDLRHMIVEGHVDETEAGRLAEGQRVTFRLDAHPDLVFEGRVASIWRTVSQIAWRDPVKYVRLAIELAETDEQKMRPGMRIRGQVEIERVADALLVPVEAVFLREASPVVYRRTALGHEVVPVELGRRNTDVVEVVGGIAERDAVSVVDRAPARGAG